MPRTRPARLLLAAAAMLAALAWVWRFQLTNGFTVTFGDRYDAMIEIALLQHWSNVLAGADAWNVVEWFHPAPDTLGYNDGYLVLGLLHALGRGLGLSIFAATDFAHAALKAAGFIGMALLLRRAGDVRSGWAVFGAALFTVADLTVSHANHGQLFTLGFAPWAALSGWAAMRGIAERDPRRVLRDAVVFAAVFALWISTAYYLAWFFALFGLVLAIVALASGSAPLVLRAWKPLAAAAVIGAVLLVPFLLVYLPKARETGMHDAAIALHTTLWPIDLVNTGPANLVWGWLPDAIRANFAPGLTRDPAATFGMTPLFLVAAIIAAVRAQRIDRRIAAVGVALLACWGLMLNLGGVMPWRAVQAVVPGAGGVRVVGRFAILLLLPATFLITVALNRLRRRGLAVVLAAGLLVEQVATSAPVSLDIAERTRALAAVVPPPAACRSFAVAAATAPGRIDPALDRLYSPNVDAMVLATLWKRATVNGVSTFGPPGWDFADSQARDYRARVRRYAARHGLSGVCLLDTRRPEHWTMLH